MRRERDAVLEKVFQDATESDGMVPAVVLEATAAEVKAVLADGETVSVTGDGLRFAARSLGDKAAAPTRIRRGAVIRRHARGEGTLGDRPDAAGRVRLRFDPAQGWRAAVAGGRLRLRAQQVQPRHAGPAAARVGVQAVHLLGGTGKGIHPGHRRQRRAVLRPGRASRRRGLGAEELRRQVRRSDAGAHGACKIEEPRDGARAPGDRPAVRAGLHRPLRLRSQAPSTLSDDGAGCRDR